jgi:hypothetical protein
MKNKKLPFAISELEHQLLTVAALNHIRKLPPETKTIMMELHQKLLASLVIWVKP